MGELTGSVEKFSKTFKIIFEKLEENFGSILRKFAGNHEDLRKILEKFNKHWGGGYYNNTAYRER